MSLSGIAFDRIGQLVTELEPGRRVWVNYPDDGWMIGGVYRDQDGNWFVYSGEVTEGATGAADAFDLLIEIVEACDVFRPRYGEEAYR